jgi:hypothetical protein
MGRVLNQPVRHGPFDHLYLCTVMMILASVVATSFVILLLFSLPSCLRGSASTPPILGRGCESKRLLPVFARYQSRHRPMQWLLHVHEGVSQHARTLFFAVVGRPVRLPVLRPVLPPNLLPLPTVTVTSRPTLVDVDTGESVLLLAFLRACRRGGHDDACHT